MSADRIAQLQQALLKQGVDGWLFYDFRQSNPIAYHVLDLSTDQIFTRRWFYWVPAQGEPHRLVSELEPGNLDALPGGRTIYRSRQDLSDGLASMLARATNIAMEYSPLAEIPVVSRVDAGTVDLLRSLGKNVVSSADLVQLFEAPLTSRQLETHLEAEIILRIVHDATLDYIRKAIASDEPLTEYSIRQFMLGLYQQYGLFTDHGPDVAVNANCSKAHYEAKAEGSSPVKRGDLLLIDWWGKLPEQGAVFADYTWVGVVDTQVPQQWNDVFGIVLGARDAAIDFVRQHVTAGEPLQGWQVDNVARAFITERGYGEYFYHRTGHNISVDLHGSGANLDNLETHDTRPLLPHTLFSIEPGIYLPTFGMRSEVNVYIGDGDILVTGRPLQTELPAILRG